MPLVYGTTVFIASFPPDNWITTSEGLRDAVTIFHVPSQISTSVCNGHVTNDGAVIEASDDLTRGVFDLTIHAISLGDLYYVGLVLRLEISAST